MVLIFMEIDKEADVNSLTWNFLSQNDNPVIAYT